MQPNAFLCLTVNRFRFCTLYIPVFSSERNSYKISVTFYAFFLRVHVFPVDYLIHKQNHKTCLRISCNALINVIYIRKCLVEWVDLQKKLKMK